MIRRVSAAAAAIFLIATGAGASAANAASNNNSANAQLCQQGGYANLYRADHTGFANAGECTSYAAHSGVFTTKKTATLTGVAFSACNAITLGYTLDATSTDLQSKPYGCFGQPGSDQTINYFSDQNLSLFLRDDTCSGWVYDQYGNHGRNTGTNPVTVDISDAGGYCESPPGTPRTPGIVGNITLTETYS